MGNDHDSGSSLVWFLAGAAIGAVAALLYAPQPGRETREALRRRASEETERLRRSGREAMERGRELYERGKGLAEDAAHRFEQGKEAAAGLYQRGREWASEARHALHREGSAEQPEFTEPSH
jgi:gas vesicle protein